VGAARRTDLGIGGGVQGVSSSVAVPEPRRPVAGQRARWRSTRPPLAAASGPGTTDGEVLLHELAHAIGLGHVLDPTR
jgi:hypothetical protein